MKFYLTNNHRKYMGLDLVQDNWELIKVSKSSTEEFYLFFDGNVIRKVIHYFITSNFIQLLERDVYYKTKNNRSIVVIDEKRNYEKELNGNVIDGLYGEKNYFVIHRTLNEEYAHVVIGNYSANRKFYHDDFIKNCSTLEDFKNWCDNYVSECCDEDIIRAYEFSKLKRKIIAYKEGDYFRVNLGKNLYGYGRIILDVAKRVCDGTLDYFDVLMGNVVVVEMFHIVTEKNDVSIESLRKLKTFPSQHLMNNNLYYGEYEIIGNYVDDCDEVLYPIMYGRGTKGEDSNKIIFQCGYIHREIPYEEAKLFGRYLNNIEGFMVDLDVETIKKCVQYNSNDYYWEKYSHKKNIDLRHPDNRNVLLKVLEEFDLDELKELYIEE